ncbi:hypothetical protein Sango_1741600 [Sesamum angolense]|uniref:Aminotransferase-like plant mobile domain-containing protein n=1 Tax=Sesamum angolense TaxID=2727404 RepID=A0AAE1WLN1_9LAMI|nr:hypothetical protein Sango_1741600 [Sesamum angolense]
MTSPIYALWVVPSLKVMQSGMVIFDLPENRYTKGYLEWIEDVLSRCGDRLHHLKVYDVFYALLFTYDYNSDIVKAFCEACVSIDKWVKFWSKKDIEYHLSPSRKEKKMVRPELTHNPLRDIATHERWSTAEEALFVGLCIKGNLKEEDYLATYLACWLCAFALR